MFLRSLESTTTHGHNYNSGSSKYRTTETKVEPLALHTPPVRNKPRLNLSRYTHPSAQ